MKIIIQFVCILLITLNNLTVLAAPEIKYDSRTSLALSMHEKADFLNEMRQMLASIQGVIAGIGDADRTQIIDSARLSGNRMARATPDSIRQKLPPSFKELGGPTHMMFEEIVSRAETDDMESLTVLTGKLLQQCVTCHALFKTD